MGTDFRHTCQVETRKVLWLIGLVLASVLIIQSFEIPYRDYFDSSDANRGDFNGDLRHTDDLVPKPNEQNVAEDNLLLENTTQMNHSSDEDMNHSSSDANRGDVNGDLRHMDELVPKPDEQNVADDSFLLENTTPMNHSSDEDMIFRSIISPSIAASPTNVTDISPSVSVVDNSAAPISGRIAASPTTVANISQSISVIDNSAGLVSGRIAASPKSLDVVLAPIVSPPELMSPTNKDIDHGTPVSPPIPSHENETSSDKNNRKSEKNNPPPEEKPVKSVVSISEMNDLLLRSRDSSVSKSPLWPSAADQELSDVRFKIEHEPTINNRPGLYAPIYRNLSTFVRSYELMEQKLKIYVYSEGKRPVFHQPRLKGIYASEGWFMKHLEASNQFLTSNPEEAHLFYLPFSSQLLVNYVYVPNSHTFDHILKYLDSYLNTIKVKHSYWNRTDGADHFVVACHDWAAFETKRLMTNCIRALCNADAKDGFQFGKDVSLPETYVHSPQNPLQETGGEPPSNRKILAFFAGQMHGKVRPTLLQNWENRDPDMKIFGKLRKGYNWHMKNSKYCICAKGYEVNSPRVVEAIIYGCVPVIISDNFVPPFFDVLNWESFAVFVPEKDIPELKKILVSISARRYAVMQQRVKQVRKHFVWHNIPVKYDIFHMILHSVWYNRLFRMSP